MTLFKKFELEELGIFYLIEFIFGMFAVVMPFAVIYFVNRGLSFIEISIIFAIYSASSFILEIPTGAFADELSRKWSVIGGMIIIGLALAIMPLLNSYGAILTAWMTIGLGGSLYSGANIAWVIDNLKSKKRKKLEKEYFIKSESILSAGFIIAPLIGSFIVKNYSMDLLWYISGISYIILGIIFVAIPEYFKPSHKSIKKAFQNNFKTIKKGFAQIKKNKNLLLIILAGSFTTIALMANDGWTPLLVNTVGFPIKYIGYFVSGASAIIIFIPFLANKINNDKKGLIVIKSLQLILLMSALLIKEGRLIIAASLFVLPKLIQGLERPILGNYTQKLIPSKIRATITSIESMIYTGIDMIVIIIAGALMDAFPIQYVIGTTSVFFIGTIIIYSKLDVKNKK